MTSLTEVKRLINRPTRRRRIERLTRKEFGVSSNTYIDVMSACDLVVSVYRGKKRKNGEARIVHEREMFMLAVATGIRDRDILVAIFLHDLYEDYPKQWPLYRIRELYGEEVAKIVAAVTKPYLRGREITSLKFSRAVFAKVNRGGKKAWIVKILDRLHYMLTPYDARDRNIWKICQTIMFVQPKAIELNVFAQELQIATTMQMIALDIRDNELPWAT